MRGEEMGRYRGIYNRLLKNQQRGICYALISNCLFVFVGVLVRYVESNIGAFQILLFRQIVFLLLLLPAMYYKRKILLGSHVKKLHLLRILSAFFALLLGFMTVRNLPLAEATALGFTKVLFVAALSSILLGEYLGKMRKLILSLGFIGVMLVVQPTFDTITFIYILTGLGSAFAAAIAVFCVKKIAMVEGTFNLLVYQAFFVGLLALVPSIVF